MLLPEDVRGSTANVLHVIRNTIRSFTNQGMKGVTRTLYGKKISNAHDLFQAMDRDGKRRMQFVCSFSNECLLVIVVPFFFYLTSFLFIHFIHQLFISSR